MTAAIFSDWYCEACNEWASERGYDCHTGHDLMVADRSKELAKVAERWRKTRERERELAAQMYELIRIAHGMGTPETQIAKIAGVDRMTVRRALGKL